MQNSTPVISVAEFLDCMKRTMPLYVRCPDGQQRKVWGINAEIGDVFVEGWKGNVWMDCSNPQRMQLEFEK